MKTLITILAITFAFNCMAQGNHHTEAILVEPPFTVDNVDKKIEYCKNRDYERWVKYCKSRDIYIGDILFDKPITLEYFEPEQDIKKSKVKAMKLTHNQAYALTEVADRNGFPVKEKKSREIKRALKFLIRNDFVEKTSVEGKKYYALTNTGFTAYSKFCKYGLEFPDEIKLHTKDK